MRTAVFDLDGTLADTSGDLIAAANACFETPVLDRVRDQSTAFRGGRAMLRLGLQRMGLDDEAVVDARFPELLRYYDANIDTHTRLYPGVEECLDVLQDAGWILAVCTNKPEALAEKLLRRLGLRPRFASMLGADSLPVRKPDPRHLLETIGRAGGQASQSVLVGDTETDSKTAAAASVPCVLVTFGPDGRGVETLRPQGLLDRYEDLPALLDQLLR